jgi:hypothetical protein
VATCTVNGSGNLHPPVPQLRNLFRQQLNTVRRIAENNALVDLQLLKQRVQAVHLLTLLHKGIVPIPTKNFTSFERARKGEHGGQKISANNQWEGGQN